jgi:probable phosphoglycerate mutase
MQLVFAHHGESTANVRRIISNRGLVHELTDLGRQQAHDLASRIQSPVLKVYTSPIRRAVETTQIVAEAWGVEYEVVDALREYDCGVLEGRSDDEAWLEHVEVRRQWYDEHNLDYRAEGGERFLDIQARFVPFVDSLLERYRDTEETIVCVGHTGTYCAMLPLVLTNVDHAFARNHLRAGTYAIVAEPRADGLFCRSWCEIPLI